MPARTADQPLIQEENPGQAQIAECDAHVEFTIDESSTSRKEYVSPEMVLPVPKAQPRKKKAGGRKKGSTKILTDTPVRN